MNTSRLKHAKLHYKTTIFLGQNYPQYDWLIDFDFHGVSEDGAFLIRPDLCAIQENQVFVAVEVSDSTVKNDLSKKMDVYRLAGVKYYIVIDCDAETVYQFELKGRDYIASSVFNGLETIFKN